MQRVIRKMMMKVMKYDEDDLRGLQMMKKTRTLLELYGDWILMGTEKMKKLVIEHLNQLRLNS